MFSSWRIVLRRALSDRLMLTAAAVTILLATTVLAASPIYSEAVTRASLHRILHDGGSAASLEISAFETPADFETYDAAVRHEVDATFASNGASVFAKAVGASMLLDVDSDDGLFPLVSVQYLEGIETRATLAQGRWPSSGDAPYEVVLFVQTATTLDVVVGDTLTFTSRRDGSEVVVEVVGIATVNDQSDLFWFGDEMIDLGFIETDTFRTFGPFVADLDTVLGPMSHLSTEMMWRVLPDHEALTVEGIPNQLRSVNTLENRVNAAVGERVAVFSVETDLGEILATAEQSVIATRSGVLMLSLQLAILAGYALVHTAGLLVDSRTVETGLLRSRGAGNGQIFTISAMEGMLLTLPAILLAPPLAALLLRILTRFGPLASIGLTFEPQVSRTAYVLSLTAALVCIIALAVPAYRSSRTFNDSLVARSRQEARSFAQRAGWDIALVTLAGVAFWQLSTYGVQLSSTLRDRWGIDPLLVAVPALGMIGGAVLALRFVPFMAGVLEQLTGMGRNTVSALSAWQISRRPQRYSRAALLLIIAVSVGFFVSAYTDTWTRSQQDQAAFMTGADIRVTPRRVPVTMSDLYLRQAHESIDGVGHSMPVNLASGQLIRGGPITRFFALDASVATDVVALREDQVGDEFTAMMNLLVESRPRLATIPLPGEPRWVHIEATVDSPDPCGGQTVLCLAPVASLVLQDSLGLLYRVTVGEIPVNQGSVSLSAPLSAPLVEGAVPSYPLELVAVELRTPMPGGDVATAHVASVALSVDVSQESGSRDRVDLDGELESGFSVPTNVSSLGEAPSIGVSASNGGVSISLNTGSSISHTVGAPIHFAIRPVGSEDVDAVPLVVTGGLLDRTGVALGNTLALTRFNTRSGVGRLVGTIDLFPAIEAGVQEAVILDLPTLQAASYVPGRRLDPPTEYWIEVEDGGVAAITEQLSTAPISSLRLRTLSDQANALTNDPMALSTIAALALGFVAALVFAVIGFTVNTIVLARERQTEFTLLRALGLSIKQLRSWLALEQAAVVLAGLVLGTLIGWVLSAIVLPLISVTQAGVVPVPEPEVVYPVTTIIALNSFVVVVLSLIISALAYSARRRDIASQLRMADS